MTYYWTGMLGGFFMGLIVGVVIATKGWLL